MNTELTRIELELALDNYRQADQERRRALRELKDLLRPAGVPERAYLMPDVEQRH